LRDDRLPTNRPLASALANRAVASGRPARYPIYDTPAAIDAFEIVPYVAAHSASPKDKQQA
jgi:hypothetical protein